MRYALSKLALAALLLVTLSCDSPVGPRTGSISLMLLTSSGAALAVAARDEVPGGETPDLSAEGAGDLPHIALSSVRVTVAGPTTRTVTSSAPVGGSFDLLIDGLAPGTYAVTVEGLVNGAVAHYGQASGISVAAGPATTAAVTFPVFQPVIPNATLVDTVDVLRYTVTYGAVPGATGYIVEWSSSPTMTGATAIPVVGTSTQIVVSAEGRYYVTVKAVNLVVTTGGLPSPTKGVYAFQGVAGVTVTPAAPTINAGATQLLTAVARDTDNNIVPNISWFWASSNHAVATVSQTGLVTGIAGGSAVVTAVAKGTPGSATVGVNALPATRLGFVGQPGNTGAGQTIPTVSIAVQNALGQTVTTDNSTQVTLAIGTDAGPGGVLAGLQTVSAVAGVATFTNLTIARAGAGYTLAATATGLTGTTSANFNVAPGVATQLAFTVQPTTVPATVAMSPAVQVTVQDALGNRVTTATAAITIAIANNPGSAILGGTAVVNAISGVASFSGLTLSVGGTGYTLSATATGLTVATSGAFNVGAILPASQLVFSVPPANATAGEPLSPAVQVEVRNSSGARVTSARDPVTIAFQANPGAGTLSGTKTVNAIDGVASFSGVSINRSAAGYSLAATSGSLTAATSATFSIAPAAPSKLAFLAIPASVAGNVAIAGGVTVRILDAFDNFVDTATTSVTLALGNNPFRTVFGGGGTLSATSLTVAAVGGVATFSNVRIDKPATGYTLSATAASTPAAASTPLNVTLTFAGSISAGSYHTCAVAPASGGYCWGANWDGQLGAVTGNTQTDSTPALVRGGLTFASITTGNDHTCGLTTGGAAYCWGYGAQGQLGNGATASSDVPVLVSGGLVFQQLDAGQRHNCGLTTASGTAAIDRQVYCWGWNSSGQLGDSTALNRNTPVRVTDPLRTAFRATSISAGGNHTCAISNNAGAAYCWGAGTQGQLGQGLLLSRPGPVIVSGAFTWTALSVGQLHTCGITQTAPTSFVARCWGYNFYGQLGDGTTTQATAPVTVGGALTTWTAIDAGGYHSCGIASTGSFCWGANWSGQLGDDSPGLVNASSPSLVAGTLSFLSISAGESHSCGRTTAAAYCWGSNDYGRLGSSGINQIKRIPTLIVQ